MRDLLKFSLTDRGVLVVQLTMQRRSEATEVSSAVRLKRCKLLAYLVRGRVFTEPRIPIYSEHDVSGRQFGDCKVKSRKSRSERHDEHFPVLVRPPIFRIMSLRVLVDTLEMSRDMAYILARACCCSV